MFTRKISNFDRPGKMAATILGAMEKSGAQNSFMVSQEPEVRDYLRHG